eukprot:TRINITY_DN63341_c0_g1_i1.p1 TRINITY_DN63341_c0_g1~~TRINITY_DN63341_c0_g1_i1.p1  ORF type:complete len:644 (-),score=109.08 TRINITY_DN63341_c0_g1_i1:39-1733(-)
MAKLRSAQQEKQAAHDQGLFGKQLQPMFEKVTQAWKRVRNIFRKACRDVILASEGVVSTCMGAGDSLLDDIDFGLVLVDEASQASEPEALIPLLRSRIIPWESGSEAIGAPTGPEIWRHFVLVGDQKQLPPVVLAEEARPGLSASLFDRLIKCGSPKQLLDVQYRMHPDICELISEEFYEGRLKSACTAEDRTPDGSWWPSSAAACFVEVPGSKENEGPGGNSFQNEKEAELVLGMLRRLRDGGVQEKDIGIISAYKAQVQLLEQKLDGFTQVEISTVDGFQGREKQVILLSTVRSGKSVGFLSDWRRLNVAVSRARCKLILFGRSKTLVRDPHWKRLLQALKLGHKSMQASPAHATAAVEMLPRHKNQDIIKHAAAPLPRGVRWIDGKNILFKQVSAGCSEELGPDGSSFQNFQEAHMVRQVLTSLLSMGDIKPSEISVIGCYPAQTALLRQLFKEQLEGMVSNIAENHPMRKRLVLLSTVRTCEQLGKHIVKDWLASTYEVAELGMVVFGNKRTLFGKSALGRFFKSLKRPSQTRVAAPLEAKSLPSRRARKPKRSFVKGSV